MGRWTTWSSLAAWRNRIEVQALAGWWISCGCLLGHGCSTLDSGRRVQRGTNRDKADESAPRPIVHRWFRWPAAYFTSLSDQLLHAGTRRDKGRGDKNSGPARRDGETKGWYRLIAGSRQWTAGGALDTHSASCSLFVCRVTFTSPFDSSCC